MVAYGGIILLAIFVVTFHSEPAKVFPLIAMFGLSAYRLIPALRTGFSGLEKLKYNEPALEVVRTDLEMPDSADRQPTAPARHLQLTRSISARSICFSYEQGQVPVIRNASFSIPAGKSTVLMGPSGVGKSTLIDLVVGLLIPQSGDLLLDGNIFAVANISSWQSMIGYVPQKVYLFDDSIARNIAVSEMSHAIDIHRVEQVCRLARLHEFIVSDLEHGYETRVGHGTKELSGGQLKRLGIARALYRSPSVLVMDEATTELDAETEEQILSEILGMDGLTKIFVTHDKALVARCEHFIYFDREGHIVEGDPRIQRSLLADG
jgi:ABC-type bacteriocin/lantibiotic exporter with double-glycine peptidase domain